MLRRLWRCRQSLKWMLDAEKGTLRDKLWITIPGTVRVLCIVYCLDCGQSKPALQLCTLQR